MQAAPLRLQEQTANRQRPSDRALVATQDSDGYLRIAAQAVCSKDTLFANVDLVVPYSDLDLSPGKLNGWGYVITGDMADFEVLPLTGQYNKSDSDPQRAVEDSCPTRLLLALAVGAWRR